MTSLISENKIYIYIYIDNNDKIITCFLFGNMDFDTSALTHVSKLKLESRGIQNYLKLWDGQGEVRPTNWCAQEDV